MDSLSQFVSNHSALLQVLNSVGLGLVALGVAVLLRSLAARSRLLSQSLSEMKSAYDGLLVLWERRAKEVDSRFEDDKRFRQLYLARLEDAETHHNKVNEWRLEEVSVLQKKADALTRAVNEFEPRCHELAAENARLRESLRDLEEQLKSQEDYTRRLQRPF